MRGPLPDVAPLPEVWDDEAREHAWQEIQRLLREGDQKTAALLLAQLNAQGGYQGTGRVQVIGEPEPYNPTALYTSLAYHFHWQPSEIFALDYRLLHGFARELELLLERQNAPYQPPQPTRDVQEQEHEAVKVALTPSIYSGPVVPIS